MSEIKKRGRKITNKLFMSDRKAGIILNVRSLGRFLKKTNEHWRKNVTIPVEYQRDVEDLCLLIETWMDRMEKKYKIEEMPDHEQ